MLLGPTEEAKMICIMCCYLHELFSGALEEVLDDGDLQDGHSDHEEHLQDGKVVDSGFRGAHSGLVSVVSRLVVLQGVLELVQLSVDLVSGPLHALHVPLGLLIAGLWHQRFVLVLVGAVVLDLKVHHFFSKSGHLVQEAELVFTNGLGVKHKVALSLLGVLVDNSAGRALDHVVHIEITAQLNCKVVADLGTWLQGENVKTRLLFSRKVESQR